MCGIYLCRWCGLTCAAIDADAQCGQADKDGKVVLESTEYGKEKECFGQEIRQQECVDLVVFWVTMSVVIDQCFDGGGQEPEKTNHAKDTKWDDQGKWAVMKI